VLSSPFCSPDLAPANLVLCPKLKIAIKRAIFKAVSLIQESVMRELKAKREEAFSRSFGSLYERCKRCAEPGGDYIECWY
jgi:hypothetical protein